MKIEDVLKYITTVNWQSSYNPEAEGQFVSIEAYDFETAKSYALKLANRIDDEFTTDEFKTNFSSVAKALEEKTLKDNDLLIVKSKTVEGKYRLIFEESCLKANNITTDDFIKKLSQIKTTPKPPEYHLKVVSTSPTGFFNPTSKKPIQSRYVAISHHRLEKKETSKHSP